MIEHVNDWLGPYMDGELQGLHLRQVEKHLETCAACRAELASLQGLSGLLKDTPPTGDFIPAERFVANVTLQLSRNETRKKAPMSRKKDRLGWWLVPAGVLGAWIFMQVVYSLSTVITVAQNMGLFGESISWFQGTQPQAAWYATTLNLFGSQMGDAGTATLAILNDINLLVGTQISFLTWQVVLVALYWGWLIHRLVSRERPLESVTQK